MSESFAPEDEVEEGEAVEEAVAATRRAPPSRPTKSPGMNPRIAPKPRNVGQQQPVTDR